MEINNINAISNQSIAAVKNHSEQVQEKTTHSPNGIQVTIGNNNDEGVVLYGSALPINLSDQDMKEIDKLFDQIDKIFETSGDKKLTADQEKQLDAINTKIDGILGTETDNSLQSLGLSETDTKALEELFNQIDKIFSSSEDKALTAQQDKQLNMLSKKVDGILGTEK